jgi:uncharacterized damage-inducible protein DinB
MNQNFSNEFAHHACYRLDESSRMVQKAFDELTETDIWKRPNAASNSIGNLILHLCGNIRQYAISSLGDSADVRQRDTEFAARDGHSKTDLLDMLQHTVEEAKAVIQKTDAESWLRIRSVQGFEFSGIGIVMHVVEHYSYHTGQIAFWTKLLKDRDLGFYAGLDLNVKNMS